MMNDQRKKRILFVCTHNSSRSQMAEGLLRALRGDRYEAYSAGTQPKEVHPAAIAAMAEIGIDIRSHRSKGLDAFRGLMFDEVWTLCDQARESCPVWAGAGLRRHQGFDDPTLGGGDEAALLATFRRVRNEIRAWILNAY
jgi:arsenate reductase (thioredoxin)